MSLIGGRGGVLGAAGVVAGAGGIELLGHHQAERVSLPSGTVSLTIPTGATYIVIFLQGFATTNISAMGLSGSSAPSIFLSGIRTDYVYAVASLANPATGNRTLSFTGGSDEVAVAAAYFSGVGSVRDYGYDNEEVGGGSVSVTLDSSISDFVIGTALTYFLSGIDINPSGSGQTVVYSTEEGLGGWEGAMVYETNPGASQTTLSCDNVAWGGIIAASLRI
jgi:hypothetical protein